MAEPEVLLPEQTEESPPRPQPLPGTLGSLRPPRLNVLLFVATAVSALWMGSLLGDTALTGLTELDQISRGLAFAVALLAILLAHEMGHFLLAKRHGVDATWPFFIPAPLLSLIGTLGAVMKLRSLPRTRHALIDIAVAGPLAGFAVTLPVLALGIRLSPVVNADGPHQYWSLARAVSSLFSSGHWLGLRGAYDLGEPLAMQLVERLVHGELPADKALALHPVAIAGWFGLLLTALNLLPLGQLDGGHLLYGLLPRLHRAVGPPISGVLVGLGVFSPFVGWLLWGLLTGIWLNRHPPLAEPEEKLDGTRRALLVAALVVMVLCFVAAPLKPIAVS